MSENSDGPRGPGNFDEASQFALMAERLSLTFPQEALSHFREGDIIEAFDHAGRQRYRSFNSFEYCNYSLAQLAAMPWKELYGCPPEIAARLIAVQENLLTGREELTWLEETLPEYEIEETRTPDRARFLVRERFSFRAVSGLNGETYVVAVRRIRPV